MRRTVRRKHSSRYLFWAAWLILADLVWIVLGRLLLDWPMRKIALSFSFAASVAVTAIVLVPYIRAAGRRVAAGVLLVAVLVLFSAIQIGLFEYGVLPTPTIIGAMLYMFLYVLSATTVFCWLLGEVPVFFPFGFLEPTFWKPCARFLFGGVNLDRS